VDGGTCIPVRLPGTSSYGLYGLYEHCIPCARYRFSLQALAMKMTDPNGSGRWRGVRPVHHLLMHHHSLELNTLVHESSAV